MTAIPINLLIIVTAQAVIWILAYRFFGQIELGIRRYLVRSVGIGVVLGILMDITLGSKGIFAYYPLGPDQGSVNPNLLPPQTMLINAIASYGIAVATIVLLSKQVIKAASIKYESYRLILIPLVLAAIGILFSPESSLMMMFAWGLLILSLGEFLAALLGLSGPLANAIFRGDWKPFGTLWGLSVSLGFLYETINALTPFWIWLPKHNLPLLFVRSLVVTLGYIVLCHPILVVWSILQLKAEEKSTIALTQLQVDEGGDRRQEPPALDPESVTEGESSREYAITKYCDFQWAALCSASDALVRGASLYLLLLGGISGLLLSSATNLKPEIRITLFAIAVASTLITSLVALVVTLGYLSGLKDLEASYRKLNHTAFNEVNLQQFFRRGYVAVLAGVLSCVVLSLVFSVGFFIHARDAIDLMALFK